MNRRNFLLSLTQLLGLTTVLLALDEVRKSVIIRSKCVGCGDCIRACPMTAISLDNGKAVVDQEKCVGCRLCLRTCSYGAPRI